MGAVIIRQTYANLGELQMVVYLSYMMKETDAQWPRSLAYSKGPPVLVDNGFVQPSMEHHANSTLSYLR